MKVVILCGGYGTRISDVSGDNPKPMIPIGPYPIIWHIMKYYSSYGHNDFVLCLGYKKQVIKDFFLSYEAHTKDFTINFVGYEPFDTYGSKLNRRRQDTYPRLESPFPITSRVSSASDLTLHLT